MNRTGRTVVKNVSVLMASQVITWGLAIALTIFLPRYLGPEEVGRFTLASSIWAIVGIFISFGMDTFLMKEVARDPDRLSDWYSIGLVLRLVFLVIGYAVVSVYLALLQYPDYMIWVVMLVGASQIFFQASGATIACLQGLERMEFISLSDIVSKGFLTVVTIALLLAGYRTIMVALVLVGSSMIGFAINFFALRRIHPLKLHLRWPLVPQMLTSSLPYMINVGIRTAYVQIDILILSWIATETAIGWYSTASRLYSTFLFIPTVLVTAIFPAMARVHANAPDEMPAIVRRNFELMLLFGTPIGLGLLIIADPITRLLYGAEFIPSGPVLAIMGIVLIMTYQNMQLGQYLISTDRQNTLTWIMTVACLVTLPLDLVLIPLTQSYFQNGAIGGALSFLITETGMTIYGVTLLPKGTLNRSSAWLAARISIAGLVMVAAAWWFRQSFIAIPIMIGAAVYLMMVWLLRIIPKEDWVLLKSLFQSALAKMRKVASPRSQPGETL